MASLFRDLSSSLGHSRRESTTPSPPPPPSHTMPSRLTADIESPLGQLPPHLTDSDLRSTAYEIFLSVCRTSSAKPLSYTAASTAAAATSSADYSSNGSPSSPALQRSLTSAAASKMKKALGLKSSPSSKNSPGSGQSKPKRAVTVGELMRVQMRVSETVDSRIRKALLRISAGQVGRRIESAVLPLELLQQLKPSDFTDQSEYEMWQKRTLRILEAGLLLHPRVPIEKSNSSAQRLKQVINGALDSNRLIETGKNNEAMQSLLGAVTSLANRSDGSVVDSCHWADGIPLNLRLYEMLLDACFDTYDEVSIIDEVDELMENIKKTWTILGIDQVLHNLCFTWVLFRRFVATGQVETDLLDLVDGQLVEVAKDAKTTKDVQYSKVLSSTLSAILGWMEKRLLAYHDTFDTRNVETMHGIVSIGVSAAKILVEDISNEYRRKRKSDVDVARSRIDTYIRSSLRTAFAQAIMGSVQAQSC